MKKLNLILGLFIVLMAFGWISISAATLDSSSNENSVFSSITNNESACIRIRRSRDNRIVANSCGGSFVYPNDRVKRGEKYKVEVSYNGWGGIYLRELSYRNFQWHFYANSTSNSYIFSTKELTVENNSNFSNIFYEATNLNLNELAAIRLPIGNY